MCVIGVRGVQRSRGKLVYSDLHDGLPERCPDPVSAEVGHWSAADAEPLFAIYARIFGDEKATAKRSAWPWQYEHNPQSRQGPPIWVARRDGRPVGQLGAMPVSLRWNGREVRASWGIDYFVAPEAEGLGDSITLIKAWMQSVDVALAVGLAPTSYLICKRLGFHDLGYVPLFEAVLDPVAIMRRRWGPLASSLSAPFLRAAMHVVRRRRRQVTGVQVGVAGEVAVGAAGEIGTEYDALWERAGTGFAACVRRDAAYVRWRYRCVPGKQYDILEARRGRALTGFVVSRHEDYRGLRLGWIVDLFAAAEDRPTRDALLVNVMRAFTDAGVARAQAFCTNQQLAADLQRHGFFTGVSRSHLVARANGVSALPLSQCGDWHVVFGDGDSDR
jgi:hypothetical protein